MTSPLLQPGDLIACPEALASSGTLALVLEHQGDRIELVAVTDDETAAEAISCRSEAGKSLLLDAGNCRTVADADCPATPVDRIEADDLLEVHKAIALYWSRRFAIKAHSGRPTWVGNSEEARFRPGEDPVPYAGRVYNDREIGRAVGSTLDFWLTLGSEGEALQKELAAFLGVRSTVLTNSGSSANLLALSALTSPKLPRDRRLRPGDEVITCAAGFPTTVAPILQTGLVPVFLDNDPLTLNPRMDQLEAAFRPGKTKAVIFAHAMGNPFDLSVLLPFCRRHGLWLIEDNCDALGSYYRFPDEEGNFREGMTGTFGDLSSQSFYPPHHLTMGEGGAVNIVHKASLKKLVESFRDWGRDCWCPSGQDNTCNNRFGWQLGDLPKGYDHKYIYSHFGYNLKPLDPQAAIGRVQLERLPRFIEARKANWHYLRRGLDDLGEFFDFCLPGHASGWSAEHGYLWPEAETRRCDPSWFGFLMLIKEDAPFDRPELARFLDKARIGHRTFFGGNLVRQPAFVHWQREFPEAFRVVGELPGADAILQRALFVGVYPGLTRVMLDYVIDQLHRFCRQSTTGTIARES